MRLPPFATGVAKRHELEIFEVTALKSVGGAAAAAVVLPHLPHHGLLVLLLLGHLDGRQLGDGRHQEVHQDVLAVGHLVHHALQAVGKVRRVQVVVVPGAAVLERRGGGGDRETVRPTGQNMATTMCVKEELSGDKRKMAK